ncbi:MAG: porphobilinogen synthase [Candidatus Eremiobacteraeota bacterium]|nr:porphobilinogen synthase [Candidatus Eremiobacteraeota bacterium]MBC5828527.1 porphobilinogen synthase [Candidatus Eremiobacteraeota bacterium]
MIASQPPIRRGSPLAVRPRRLRLTKTIRRLVAEHKVAVDDLVEPLFVVSGRAVRDEIWSMPGVYRQSVDRIAEDAKAAANVGIPAVLLFGIPADKNEEATSLCDPKGPVQQAIAAIKAAAPDLLVIADLCACEYTSHGHCGLLNRDGKIDNDRSVELLARGALSYANCGVDIVAPSDMMDGRVGAIRRALDAAAFTHTGILSYAVKYASAFYGPFREAVDSAPQFGDRRTHQMDAPNAREAIKEALLDVAEGADMVMVKPALSYLDVLQRVKAAVQLPVAAYSVSGEYAMIKAAAARGWINEEQAADELLVSCKRAGADFIVTYFARAAAQRIANRR